MSELCGLGLDAISGLFNGINSRVSRSRTRPRPPCDQTDQVPGEAPGLLQPSCSGQPGTQWPECDRYANPSYCQTHSDNNPSRCTELAQDVVGEKRRRSPR